jgi:hypothetical protein
MQKGKLRILFIILIGSALLTQSFLPHHHHDDALVCIEKDHCVSEAICASGEEEHHNDFEHSDNEVCTFDQILLNAPFKSKLTLKKKEKSNDSSEIIAWLSRHLILITEIRINSSNTLLHYQGKLLEKHILNTNSLRAPPQ